MNLADALARKGRSDEAMVHYEEAIRLQPNYADAYYNRGMFFLQKVALTKRSLIGRRLSKCTPMTQMPTPALVMLFCRKGRTGAIAHYVTALALAPEILILVTM
jgi:Tetratricopeptide repeat.